MNKELFVSATPHETKVGITEDDQLAEIYLERENEYTLAGSIYKGRVTRVLPGMQSAFVDIGLERDAFLYVSDFMDLEQQDEDLDEAIPANRPVNEAQPRRVAETGESGEARPADPGTDEGNGFETAAAEPGNTAEPSRDSRDFRGRRRRRGRRPENGGRGASGDRGEARPEPRGIEPRTIEPRTSEPRTSEPRTSDSRTSDSRNDVRSDRGERSGRFEPRGGSSSRFQRPTSTGRTGRDYDYGPPPGYQPIILPGESISKYQRQAQSAALSVESTPEQPVEPSVLSSFPDDEPIFAVEVTEPLHEQHDRVSQPETYEEAPSAAQEEPSAAVGTAQQGAGFRHEAQPVAAAGPDDETGEYEIADEADFAAALRPDTSTQEIMKEVHHEAMHGHVEEQEIEEEEADLAAYGEEPGDDDGVQEVEEETRAAGGELLSAGVGATPTSGAESTVVTENGEVPEAVLEAEEREEEELELEEAQAEAEALLEAEAIGDGTVDASAEVRGPAPEARLLQRT